MADQSKTHGRHPDTTSQEQDTEQAKMGQTRMLHLAVIAGFGGSGLSLR